MRKFNHNMPELYIEKILSEDDYEKKRRWVSHAPSLSRIEFILLDELEDFEFHSKNEMFIYENNGIYQNWLGVFVQNNTEITNFSEQEVLKLSWNYFKKYLEIQNRGLN